MSLLTALFPSGPHEDHLPPELRRAALEAFAEKVEAALVDQFFNGTPGLNG